MDDYQEIHMPNGDVLQFPTNMSDDQIKGAIRQHVGSNLAPFSAPGFSLPPEKPLPLGQTARDMSMETFKGVPIAGPYAAEPMHAAIAAGLGSGDYESNLAKYKGETTEFEKRFPAGSAGLQAVGGAAATLPAAAAAPALFGASEAGTAANMAMGAFGGTAVGAADAYMRGQNPLVGGAIGGTVGGVAPALGRGVGAAAEGVRDFVSPATRAGALKNIDPRAVQWAMNAARADGLTAAQINQKFQQLGPEGFLAEYGPNMRGLAGAVAAMPGQGKSNIFGAMEARKSDVSARVEDAFNAALGSRANVVQSADDIIARRAAQATPLYQRAYDAGDKVIWSDEIGRLTGAPEVQDAMRSAVTGWQRSQIASGYGAAKPGAITDNGMLKILGGKVPAFPNLQFWDYTKSALDDMILRETRPDGSMTRKGADLVQIVQKLRGELDSQVPEYQAARSMWEGESKVHQAIQSGQTALRRSVSADQLRSEVQNMNQSEKDAFVLGLRGDLARQTDASVNGDTTARNLIRSKAAQDKLEALIGPDKTQQLAQAMDREATFADTHNRTLQNSETAARQAMGKMLQPNPDDTLISRLRHAYSPHVTPGGLLPRAFEKSAAERQEAQYEASRDALAPMLVKQGSDARSLALALMEANSRGSLKPKVSRYTSLLLQGAVAPEARLQGMQLLSNNP